MSVLLLVMACALLDEPKELLPGVWVEDGIVEIDASVAMDCHHPETPDVYLEMLITGPDTREHESLLVSKAIPSNLHAGLLAAGFEPGHPMRFDNEGGRIPSTGDGIEIQVRVGEDEDWIDLVDWVTHVESDAPLSSDEQWGGFVFAGSRFRDGDVYAADGEGALVSLTPWGFEVVSPAWSLSPDASVDEPVWIADRDQVPEIGAKVRVRFSRIEEVEDETNPELDD